MGKVTIKFRGLTCFVRDESDRETIVLLPNVTEPDKLRVPGVKGSDDVCEHYPRLLLPYGIPEVTSYPCYSAMGNEPWHCFDLIGCEVLIDGTAPLDCSRLMLTRLDQLTRNSGSIEERAITAGLLRSQWREVGGSYPLAAARVVMRSGHCKTLWREDGNKVPIRYAFAWMSSPMQEMAEEVQLTFDSADFRFLRIVDADGEKHELPANGDNWVAIIENNCMTGNQSEAASGSLDFMAYYNLLSVPQRLVRLPYPILAYGEGEGGDAQCSPAEYRGGG